MKNTLLLDLRGFVYKSLSAGSDPDSIIGEDFTTVNSASYGVRQFFKNVFPKLMTLVKAPSDIIMCSDRGHNFRSKVYPGYKVKPIDESGLKEQLILAETQVVEIMKAIGATHVYKSGEEADDIIYTLSKKLSGNKIVYTIDKDLIALTDKTVTVYKDGELARVMTVKEGDDVFYVDHKFITLYLSLVGDHSDKIPGCKGFGKKAWKSLSRSDIPLKAVEDYLHTGVMPKSTDPLISKLLEKLSVSGEWRMSYVLASMRFVGLDSLHPLQWFRRVPTEELLADTLTKYKLHNTLFDTLNIYSATRHLVTAEDFDEVLSTVDYLLSDSIIVGFDYETTDKEKRFKELNKRMVDALNSTITGFSISLGANLSTAFYFPVRHKDTDNVTEDQLNQLFDLLIKHPSFKVAHNSSFEGLVTRSQLHRETLGWTDTAQLAHVLDENSRVGLKALSSRYLEYKQTSYADVIDQAKTSKLVPDFDSEAWDSSGESDDVMEDEVEEDFDMESLTGDQVLNYGCDDSIVTTILLQHLSRLAQVEGCFRHVMLSERDANALLANITYSGIAIDWSEVNRQHDRDLATMQASLTKIDEVLKLHCSEAKHEGLHTFFADHEAYFYAKKTEAKVLGSDEAIEKAKKLPGKSMEEWSKFMLYTPLTKFKKPKTFKLTVSQFNKLVEVEGLSPITAISRKGLESWLIGSDKSNKLSSLLLNMLNGLEGAEDELNAYGSKVLTELQDWSYSGTELKLTSSLFRQKLLYILLCLPIRIRSKAQKGSFRAEYKLRGAPAGNSTAIVNALIYDCGGENAWKIDILNALADYNKAATRCSNYWSKWPVWACKAGRLHPYFRRLGTKTGRPTSSNPNFNSIDKKADTRACVVPPFKDWVIFSGDFANQEMRRLANVSKDKGLIDAFVGENKVDLHSILAVEGAHFLLPLNPQVDIKSIKFNGVTALGSPIIDYDWYEVNRDKTSGYAHFKFLNTVRDASKIVNFGVAYGVTPQSLSEQVRIPLEAAEMFFKLHEERFPGIPLWKDKLWKGAALVGYIDMYNGVRRHCGDNLMSGKPFEVSRWERQIANSDIQGWCGYYAGEMLGKVKRSGVFGRLEDTSDGLQLVTDHKVRAVLYVNLYDELMGACHKDDIHELIHLLKPMMEESSNGDLVPQVTDWSIGKNWKEQVEIGKAPSIDTVNKALDIIFKPKEV